MRAIGPSMSGDKASVSLAFIACLGLLGGELSPNPHVTLVPVTNNKVWFHWQFTVTLQTAHLGLSFQDYDR